MIDIYLGFLFITLRPDLLSASRRAIVVLDSFLTRYRDSAPPQKLLLAWVSHACGSPLAYLLSGFEGPVQMFL